MFNRVVFTSFSLTVAVFGHLFSKYVIDFFFFFWEFLVSVKVVPSAFVFDQEEFIDDRHPDNQDSDSGPEE